MKIISTIDDTAKAEAYWKDWTRRIRCGQSTDGCGTVFEIEPSDLKVTGRGEGYHGHSHNATVNCPVCNKKFHIKAPAAMVRWLAKQKEIQEMEERRDADTTGEPSALP